MEFTAPSADQFVLTAWSADLRRLGPFVLPSQKRKHLLARLRDIHAGLEGAGYTSRLLETTFLPPLSGAPKADVVLLAHGTDLDTAAISSQLDQAHLPVPVWQAPARNIVRFGDTNTANRSGPVLLNHFVGSSTPAEAVQTWKAASHWYRTVLGVDNSTLLRPGSDDTSSYLVINYAVVPGPVLRFMINQLLRPSFYRAVIGPLRAIGTHACPLFARRIL